MEEFTPISALAGGLMIGAAAALAWLGLGRVAGISGVFGGVLGGLLPGAAPGEVPARGGQSAKRWRWAFLAGLLAAPLLWRAMIGPIEIRPPENMVVLALGGLLVGLGSRLGSGCTSGHGVCGLARGSTRSFTAVMVFFSVAVATVFFVRHVWG